MLANADSVSVSDCVLPDAGDGAGFAACALVVDSGLVGARSVLFVADCDGDQHVCDAADYAAAGGDGSAATEDDDVDDADHDGIFLLEFRGGVEFVLRGKQFDSDGAAGGDEQDQAGTRDAGDAGEAGAEEG